VVVDGLDLDVPAGEIVGCEAGPGGRGWLVRARLPLTALPGTALPHTGAAP
jgi:hypothetical protein